VHGAPANGLDLQSSLKSISTWLNYDDCEGRRATDIRAKCPGWRWFGDGRPGGESPLQVSSGSDRVMTRFAMRTSCFSAVGTSPRVGAALAGPGTVRQCGVFHGQHSKSEHSGSRARPFPAGYPVVE